MLTYSRLLLAKKTWLSLHRWMGLIVGFWFAILGLTGSISIYRAELDALLNPELVISASPDQHYQSLDKIIATIHQRHPSRYGAWTLEMPKSNNDVLTVWYDKPQETYFDYYAPLMVSVNPYTGEIISERFWGQTVTTWILDLHTQLRLGGLGWQSVGLLGILMFISIATGVYLWRPSLNEIKRVVVLRQLSLIQFFFLAHKHIGLLVSPLLLVLIFTGVQLSFPKLLPALIGSEELSHGNNGQTVLSTAKPNNKPVRLDEAEFIARAPFPNAEVRRITIPVGETGAYRVNLRQSNELNHSHPMTMVWLDRWSGHIKDVQNPNSFSFGQSLLTWLWPVHTGEAFGATSRLLWFITGLLPGYLYVTGLMHWLHKRRWVNDKTVDVIACGRQIRYNSVKIMAWLMATIKAYTPKCQAKLNDWRRKLGKLVQSVK